MKWENIREKYPNIWVLIEAIEAESKDGERILNKIAVLNYYETSEQATKEYIEIHKTFPEKELYVCHTQNENLLIKEKIWMGVRSR